MSSALGSQQNANSYTDRSIAKSKANQPVAETRLCLDWDFKTENETTGNKNGRLIHDACKVDAWPEVAVHDHQDE